MIYALALLSVLASLMVMQTIYVFLYRRWMSGDNTLPHNEEYDPAAAVILCLRGVDPGLEKCLTGITGQDYPNFQFHCVFDHPADPAKSYVEEFAAVSGANIFMHVVPDFTNVNAESDSNCRSEARGLSQYNCGLKCRSLVHAITQLDPEIEVVALVDADSVPDANFLRDLIRPLQDPKTGATTGNRWFVCVPGNFASSVRQLWNAAAVVQMYLYRIAWGGALAIRRDVIHQTDLVEKWSAAFCEDTMLTSVLEKHGLRVLRVPDLVLINGEPTTLRGTLSWIARQLLTARLYHRAWPLVLVHALGIAVVVFGAALFVVGQLALGDWAPALLLAAGLLAFQLCSGWLLLIIAKANESALKRRNTNAGQNAALNGRPLVAAMLVTQLFYPIAGVRAWLAKTVVWRGIEYRIGPGTNVEMLRYQPYAELASDSELVSL